MSKGTSCDPEGTLSPPGLAPGLRCAGIATRTRRGRDAVKPTEWGADLGGPEPVSDTPILTSGMRLFVPSWAGRGQAAPEVTNGDTSPRGLRGQPTAHTGLPRGKAAEERPWGRRVWTRSWPHARLPCTCWPGAYAWGLPAGPGQGLRTQQLTSHESWGCADPRKRELMAPCSFRRGQKGIC